MAEKDQFYSFDEALKELRLKEEELRRLVSEGEIRAFREGDTMKLRRADVENLRAELSGGEVVDLGDVKEELVFEDDPTQGEAGMATQEIGMATEEIASVETVVEEAGDEVALPEVEREPAAARAERSSAISTRAPEPPEEYEGAGVRALLMLTTLLLLVSVPLMLAVATGKRSPLAESVGSLVSGEPSKP